MQLHIPHQDALKTFYNMTSREIISYLVWHKKPLSVLCMVYAVGLSLIIVSNQQSISWFAYSLYMSTILLVQVLTVLQGKHRKVEILWVMLLQCDSKDVYNPSGAEQKYAVGCKVNSQRVLNHRIRFNTYYYF